MSIYIAPSFINLVIKLWLFWYGRQSFFVKNRTLGLLLLAFFCLNLTELMTFLINDLRHPYIRIVVRLWWVSAVSSAMMMLIYADSLTYRKIRAFVPAGIIAALSLLLLFTDQLIAGETSLAYVINHIPGPYYWILQSYVLLCVISALILLIKAGPKLQTRRQRQICAVTFIGYLFIVAATISVIFMMELGIKINAAGIVTSTITIFLGVTWLILHAENDNSLLHLLITVPVVGTQIAGLFLSLLIKIFRTNTIDFDLLKKELEIILLFGVLDLNEGKRRAAADQLNMPISTFNEKIRKIQNS